MLLFALYAYLRLLILNRPYVLFFLHLESRRTPFTDCTESPNSGWVTQQARNPSWELTELGLRPRFLIRDRDTKFAAAVDSVPAAEGTEVRRTPARSPQAKPLTDEFVKRYEDWELEDPAGKSLDEVRKIRDELAVRVKQLTDELRIAGATS